MQLYDVGLTFVVFLSNSYPILLAAFDGEFIFFHYHVLPVSVVKQSESLCVRILFGRSVRTSSAHCLIINTLQYILAYCPVIL